MARILTDRSLTRNNHTLMTAVRERVNAGLPMAMVAMEVGVDPDALCDWILNIYREPDKVANTEPAKKPKLEVVTTTRDHWSTSHQAQRFANWRRARMAAATALHHE